jgi:hypothetical protein
MPEAEPVTSATAHQAADGEARKVGQRNMAIFLD